jgi:YfiH family protein
MITVSALNDINTIRHAFFTREGGVSRGIFSSLNCGFGSGDDLECVRENRRLALTTLELTPDVLVTVRQEHTATVVAVDRAFPDGKAPAADAMVTKKTGLALGVLTADCAPILMCDGKAGVIAAAHAGWRGALSGVLETTIKAMVDLGAKPNRITAAIGPCIGYSSYEVGPDFPALFLPSGADFFAPSPVKPGHFLFDLAGFVARKLALAGLTEVSYTPCDTVRDESRFFSYRRSVLRGEGGYGRQLSVIALEK